MSIEFGPASFSALPLKRLVEIRSSNVDKIVDPDEQRVRLCNYVDVYYNNLIRIDLPLSVGSATHREIRKFCLREDDVLITKDSETPDDIAVPAFVEQTAEDIVCGYHLALLRPFKERIKGKFLFNFLKSHSARAAFYVRAQGITRFGLTLPGIGSVLCPAPGLEVQESVVNFLDVETALFDRMIEKAGGQDSASAATPGSFLNILLEQRAALITAAVTGQIDVETWAKRGGGRPSRQNKFEGKTDAAPAAKQVEARA